MPEKRDHRTRIKGQAAGSSSQDTADSGQREGTEGGAELGEPGAAVQNMPRPGTRSETETLADHAGRKGDRIAPIP